MVEMVVSRLLRRNKEEEAEEENPHRGEGRPQGDDLVLWGG